MDKKKSNSTKSKLFLVETPELGGLAEITTTQIKKLLKAGETDVIKGFKGRKEFDAALSYNKEAYKLSFVFPK